MVERNDEGLPKVGLPKTRTECSAWAGLSEYPVSVPSQQKGATTYVTLMLVSLAMTCDSLAASSRKCSTECCSFDGMYRDPHVQTGFRELLLDSALLEPHVWLHL